MNGTYQDYLCTTHYIKKFSNLKYNSLHILYIFESSCRDRKDSVTKEGPFQKTILLRAVTYAANLAQITTLD